MKEGSSDEPEIFEQADAAGEPEPAANGGPPDGAQNGALDGASVVMPGGGAYPDDMFSVDAAQTNGAGSSDAVTGALAAQPVADADVEDLELELNADPELETPLDAQHEPPTDVALEESGSHTRESFAPPGMRDRPAGGIVIADRGGLKKPAAGSAGKKRIRLGLKKKQPPA